MQCTRILLVRHGETAWNAEGRMQGHLDIPLNANGLEQARRLAEALAPSEAIDAIYSSDLARASETARPLARRLGVPLRLMAQLRERHFGAFQGLALDEAQRQWPADAERWRRREPGWSPPGGGESLLQLQARIVDAVTQLAERHLGRGMALFTHGGVLDIVYRHATGQGLQAPRTWAIGNGAVNRLLWAPDTGLRLLAWCDTSHLQARALDEDSP